MKTVRFLGLAALLLLTACGRDGGPAPVELRGVGAGETTPMAAGSSPITYPGSADTTQTIGSGTYQPPAGYAAPSQGIQTAPLGEPTDAYSQAATTGPITAPTTLSPAAGAPQPLGQTLPPAGASTPTVTAAAPVTLPSANASALGSGQFGWPLRGNVLTTYGSSPGGQANDGLNIAAPLGTAVYASKDGAVAYAGNEVKGFGNMVLIRHDGGYFTVYAHLDQILVSKDQVVTKGMPVGTVGQSGGVSQPQLHFEIRRGSTPQDPKKYLGS